MSAAYLSLGSNLGDRLNYLRRAISDLNTLDGVHVVRLSSVYETEPVGVEGQPAYLNLVAVVSTRLDPHALLAACHDIERAHGRVRTVRWGARTLDIDLLLYDGVEMDTPKLTLPHPRMHERAFVLVPLLEVAPDIAVSGTPAREWLRKIRAGAGQAVERFASTDGWLAQDSGLKE